jgi:DNA-binding beta-propeller fold protein YncE
MRKLIVAFLFAALAASAATLLVLNKEGALAIVDPSTNKVLATVRTGNGPHEVEASEDGKLAFVTNYGTGGAPGASLSVIDLAARKETRVDLGALRQPHGVAVSQGKAWFTAEANMAIGRYDPVSNKLDWILGTGQGGTHMVMFAPGGRQIITANIAGNSISIFDQTGTSSWTQTVVPVGQGPEGFDIMPGGKQLWAAHSRDGGVSVVDLASKKVLQTFNVQTKRSNRLKFSPDGRLALISDLEAGELLILEQATKKELKRLKLGRSPAGIVITPDSSRAYVAVTGDDNVAIIDLKTLELIERFKTGTGPDGMAWIP